MRVEHKKENENKADTSWLALSFQNNTVSLRSFRLGVLRTSSVLIYSKESLSIVIGKEIQRL